VPKLFPKLVSSCFGLRLSRKYKNRLEYCECRCRDERKTSRACPESVDRNASMWRFYWSVPSVSRAASTPSPSPTLDLICLFWLRQSFAPIIKHLPSFTVACINFRTRTSSASRIWRCALIHNNTRATNSLHRALHRCRTFSCKEHRICC
jgi:hypothetical protein